MAKTKPLYDAVRDFLCPIMAEYGEMITDGAERMPVIISLGGKDGYEIETTLADLKALERAWRKQYIRRQAEAKRRRRSAML